MTAHYTASAVVLNESAEQVLMVYHRKGGGWLYPGGHLLPGEDPATGVLREVKEETGLDVELLTVVPTFHHPTVRGVPAPVAVLDVPVRDRLVGGHNHIDFVYAARPVQGATNELRPQWEEVAECRWVPLNQIAALPGLPAELPDLIAFAVHYLS